MHVNIHLPTATCQITVPAILSDEYMHFIIHDSITFFYGIVLTQTITTFKIDSVLNSFLLLQDSLHAVHVLA